MSASLLAGSVLVAVGFACVQGESLVPTAEAGEANPTIVVNLQQGTNNPHAVAMAFELANTLLDKGADVTIYASVEGVRVFDARQPDQRLGDVTIGQLHQRFISGGGNVLVCPMCAEVIGLEPEHLRAGAAIGSMDRVAEVMLAADKVIDY